MRFSITAVLAISTSVHALSVQDIVSSLDSLTGQVQTLVDPASTVTALNATTVVPEIISGLNDVVTTATTDLGGLLNLTPVTDVVNGVVTGATDAVSGVVTGATDAVSGAVGGVVTGATNAVNGVTNAVTGAVTGATNAVTGTVTGALDNLSISNAFNQFLSVFQQVLHLLVSNAGVFAQLPLVGPGLAVALVAVGGIVDGIASGLTTLLQHVDLTNQANSLTATIQTAVGSLSGPATNNKRAIAFVA